MSDLFLGQTCTEQFKFISASTAHTFQFNFQPDKVTFYNLTQWAASAGNLPVSVWFRDQTTTAHAFQQQVIIDSGGTGDANFVDTATNGFTVADTSGGPESSYATISNITQADPCVITHSAYTFQDNQIIRITDLGSDMPTARGMDQLNNNRYQIVVLTSTTFSLKDPVTGLPVDSTNFTAYVSGGRITLESHVITLNNPQLTPSSYTPNPFVYDPINYRLTAGTAVMGDDGDVFSIEVIKYGQVTDLGDLVT